MLSLGFINYACHQDNFNYEFCIKKNHWFAIKLPNKYFFLIYKRKSKTNVLENDLIISSFL
ncbi:hypothetical protein BpHYR1_014967 [Brachionus plicatilis]|uniref:Uncharacterized protein n=1 Tax=Brachionus plicatilis TaxID=10195 RepID=A0A3M7QUC3_BRAPC|nr:hypothetical protein BpHYR1_014967 [Brachionus plicatilis]